MTGKMTGCYLPCAIAQLDMQQPTYGVLTDDRYEGERLAADAWSTISTIRLQAAPWYGEGVLVADGRVAATTGDAWVLQAGRLYTAHRATRAWSHPVPFVRLLREMLDLSSRPPASLLAAVRTLHVSPTAIDAHLAHGEVLHVAGANVPPDLLHAAHKAAAALAAAWQPLPVTVPLSFSTTSVKGNHSRLDTPYSRFDDPAIPLAWLAKIKSNADVYLRLQTRVVALRIADTGMTPTWYEMHLPLEYRYLEGIA